jgi:septum site-determining protein MinD
MTKVIAVHSSRGGVGKTLVAVNLGAAYAKKGKNTCIVDLDFRAPSIYTIPKLTPKHWINDFFNDRSMIHETLVDVTGEYNSPGKLYMALANPEITSIRDVTTKNKSWEMQALRKLFKMKRELSDKVELIILDTSPGFQYSSTNAVACSDVVLAVTTPDRIDLDGTIMMIKDLYYAFEKQVFIFINKFQPHHSWNKNEKHHILTQIPAPIIAITPCFCDMLNAKRTNIYTIKNPEHPFSEIIYQTIEKIQTT